MEAAPGTVPVRRSSGKPLPAPPAVGSAAATAPSPASQQPQQQQQQQPPPRPSRTHIPVLHRVMGGDGTDELQADGAVSSESSTPSSFHSASSGMTRSASASSASSFTTANSSPPTHAPIMHASTTTTAPPPLLATTQFDALPPPPPTPAAGSNGPSISPATSRASANYKGIPLPMPPPSPLEHNNGPPRKPLQRASSVAPTPVPSPATRTSSEGVNLASALNESTGFRKRAESSSKDGAPPAAQPPAPAPKPRKVVTTDEKTQVFEYVFVVGLSQPQGSQSYVPAIVHRYPPAPMPSDQNKRSETTLSQIPQFCFPDAHILQPVTAYTSETFSFVLTELDGTKRFGYCRRLLPADSTNSPRLPEVYCIISRVGSFDVFDQILNIVEKRRAHAWSDVYQFLQCVAATPFPEPGESALIKIIGSSDVTLTRPNDSLLLEHVSFKALFGTFAVTSVLQIFCSLLLERRFIFLSSSLAKLSQVANAAVALLYPFEWQHVFIPILPAKLLDFCCSPTPFVVGVLADNMAALNRLPLDEVIIVDIDTGSFIRQDVPEGQDAIDYESMPSSLVSQVEKALKHELEQLPNLNVDDAVNEVVFEAFLPFMVSMMIKYRNYFQEGAQGYRFKLDEFVGSGSKDVRRLREMFVQSQMFHSFIEDRENAMTYNTSHPEVETFEEALDLYEDSYKNGMTVMPKLKIKHIKSGMKAAKGRFKKFYKLAKKAAINTKESISESISNASLASSSTSS